jgi:hypothetical protein
MAPDDDRPHRRSTTLAIATVMFVAGAAMFAFGAWRSLTEPDPFDPLDLSEIQRVYQPTRGNDGIPIITWGDPLIIQARKCNTHDTPVTIAGRFWLEFKAPATVERIPLGAGTDLRVPGCTLWLADPITDCPIDAAECRQAFTNLLHEHPDVAPVLEQLLADDIELIVELSGEETPDAPNSVTRLWTTEVFRIVPP